MHPCPIPPEKARLLRLLRKTASVYLLLHCTHDPLGESDIAALLELDRETVRNYLRSLQAVGLVERLASRHGWALTPESRELFALFNPPNIGAADDVALDGQKVSSPPPQPAPATFFHHPIRSATADGTTRPLRSATAEGTVGAVAENPPLHTTATTAALNILKPLKSSVAVVVDPETWRAQSAGCEDARSQDQGFHNVRKPCEFQRNPREDFGVWTAALPLSRPQTPILVKACSQDARKPDARKRDEHFREARDALREAGIYEPTASSLAKLEHVTAEYVERHALRARYEGTPTGLLVHRIRCADPAPELNRRGHLQGCTCDECQRDRYLVGFPEYDQDEPEITAELDLAYA